MCMCGCAHGQGEGFHINKGEAQTHCYFQLFVRVSARAACMKYVQRTQYERLQLLLK